ncbi:mandelate racemase/muconate lactonizing enzyme family protein [Gaiella sp.]|uniref:mandelate racemase/muconate lactonizing enzyme family protein n=1 Tax=Gaiella sp. TaxID=2663207 RepID=UPI003267B23F
MRITEIETLPVSVGPGYEYAVIIVLVRTDEGLTGIGEASLAGRGRGVLGILDHFRDLLVGQDPGKIEHWWGEMTRGTFWSNGQVIMSAVAGIDLALWDLKGKRLGVPVYELLGGPTRDRVRVYRHLAGDSTEALVEDALRWRSLGFTALRYGPLAAFDEEGLARWDPQRSIVETIAATEALRGALGEGVDLLLDAHTMFSPAEAAYLGRGLEPFRLYFYEDPIRPLNPSSLQLVRDKVNLPLATGEQLSHKWEFQPLIENELVDYLRIDMVHAGGITEAKKILAAGEMHGQRSALHHASSPVNGVACLHVDMAVPNFGIQEWMELEPLYELFPNAPRATDGYVVPPAGPGFGLELDEDEARRRPSRDAALPSRSWPDGGVADY